MKNFLSRFAVVALMAIVALVAIAPVGVSAQTTSEPVPGCPPGAIYNYLTGKLCSEPTSGTPNPSTDLIVKVVGTPSLKLSYDLATKQEASLTATANVSITAGMNDVLVPEWAFNMTFQDVTKTKYSPGATSQFKLTSGGAWVGTIGQGGYVRIPAGTTATFALTASVNPKIMFAGQYYASLNYIGLGLSNDVNFTTSVQVPENKSNSVTIVGERSPYINSISATSNLITLTGVRFANYQNQVTVDGKLIATLPSVSNAGKVVTFNPAKYGIGPGEHTLSINHPVTGRSNTVWFNLGNPEGITYNQEPLPSNTINNNGSFLYRYNISIAPTGKEFVYKNDTFYINKTGINLNDLQIRVYSDKSRSVVNKLYFANTNVPAMPDGQAYEVQFVTPVGFEQKILPGQTVYFDVFAIPGSYKDSAKITTGHKGLNDVTIAAAPSTNFTVPTVSVNSSSLKLSYDSSSKESALTGTFNITLSAGATEARFFGIGNVEVYSDSGKDQNLNNIERTFNLSSNLNSYTDMYNRKVYILPPGQKVNATITGIARPSEMFAGSHYMFLRNVIAPTTVEYSQQFVDLNAKTNSVVVVGETNVLKPTLTVTSPTSGKDIMKGSTFRISWKSEGVSSVYIKLRKGTDTYYGAEGAVVSGVNAAQGYYDWYVPTTLPNGTDYQIRVLDTAGKAIDDSDGYFIISSAVPTPTITGDYTGDGKVNADDLEVVTKGYGTKYTFEDLNKVTANMGNGLTIPALMPFPGDTDFDGAVGFSDQVFISAKLGSVYGDGKYSAKADFNLDGKVDYIDFAHVSKNFNKTGGPKSAERSVGFPDLLAASAAYGKKVGQPGYNFDADTDFDGDNDDADKKWVTDNFGKTLLLPPKTGIIIQGAVLGVTTSVGGTCTVLAQNLQKGSMDLYSEGEVTMLQNFLETQGYGFPEKGNFGPVTESALKGWQGKQGITPSGVTGPLTREKIASVSCN